MNRNYFKMLNYSFRIISKCKNEISRRRREWSEFLSHIKRDIMLPSKYAVYLNGQKHPFYKARTKWAIKSKKYLNIENSLTYISEGDEEIPPPPHPKFILQALDYVERGRGGYILIIVKSKYYLIGLASELI